MFSLNAKEVVEKIFIPLRKKLLIEDTRKNTVELLATRLEFNPFESEFLDYGETRPASKSYIYDELLWYGSQDLNINGHSGIQNNSTWKRCATKDGNVNSNYGHLVYSLANGSQFQHALEALLNDEYTRQSVIIYNRPEMQVQSKDGIHANYDFTCTMYTQQFIDEKSRLIMIVNMRSNDAIYGLQNDYTWQRQVYMEMYNKLRGKYPSLQPGKIIWLSGSTHVYEWHYDLLIKIVKEYRKK